MAQALYDLLKGINRRHASLIVTLIVVSMPIAFLNELNSYSQSALFGEIAFMLWLLIRDARPPVPDATALSSSA